jgi:hypothetical protein
VTVDLTDAPPQRPGSVNCTDPETVAVARTATGALAGRGEASSEGRRRAISMIIRVTVRRRSALELQTGGGSSRGDPAEHPERHRDELRRQLLFERRGQPAPGVQPLPGVPAGHPPRCGKNTINSVTVALEMGSRRCVSR